MITVIDTLHDRVTQEVAAFVFAWKNRQSLSLLPFEMINLIARESLAILSEVPKLPPFEQQPAPTSSTIPGERS